MINNRLQWILDKTSLDAAVIPLLHQFSSSLFFPLLYLSKLNLNTTAFSTTSFRYSGIFSAGQIKYFLIYFNLNTTSIRKPQNMYRHNCVRHIGYDYYITHL